jgi:hypothetical protein
MAIAAQTTTKHILASEKEKVLRRLKLAKFNESIF